LPQVLGSPGLWGDTLATVGYVANWHLVAAHTNYFDTVAAPSPLTHTWSLAIEEQFYLVWPLIVLLVSGGLLLRKRSAGDGKGMRKRLTIVAAVAAIGALASAALMAVLTPVGAASLTPTGVAAVNRSYYGSDTRAQSLLVGAALAAILLLWGPIRTRAGRWALWTAGAVGAAGIVAMWLTVNESSALTFHGGFLLLSVATASVIACVTAIPTHPVTRFLSLPPFAYLGRISYGMYLWYLPVLVVMTSERTHLVGLPLLLARFAVIVGFAVFSFHLLETPIRRGALAGWRSWVAVPAAALVVSLVPLLAPSLSALVPTAAAAVSTHLPQLDTSTQLDQSTPPVRILLVGDSMAGSLGVGMSLVAARYGAELVNAGSPGCSVGEGSMVQVLWYTIAPGQPCEPSDPPHLLDVYRSLVEKFDPDVVVYLARADTLNTELGGAWVHVGDPSYDQWMESRFQQAISVFGSTGAHVVMLTSPYYDSGEQPDGQPWPENAPVRVSTDNRLLRQATLVNPTGSSVINLGTLVSPAGEFSTDVDGVPVRCSDGVHFTVPGGEWVGEHVLPELITLGRPHADAPAQLNRPLLPPQTQPGWYSNLPCGV
jgi:peptidoglycan/LPS O-acetylase OafA/YrhL